MWLVNSVCIYWSKSRREFSRSLDFCSHLLQNNMLLTWNLKALHYEKSVKKSRQLTYDVILDFPVFTGLVPSENWTLAECNSDFLSILKSSYLKIKNNTQQIWGGISPSIHSFWCLRCFFSFLPYSSFLAQNQCILG